MEFKDTIMGKITKGAIISWGENDENGNWFTPTEEQAEQMLSEGGLTLGEKVIDYSSSDKATNDKTYGSEVAAINGLVELISKSNKEMTPEERQALTEQIKTEIYTQGELSPEMQEKIKKSFERLGTNASMIEVLKTIHDNWVKTNPNNFLKPNRNKERQFVPLQLLDWKEVESDLLFLKPIIEGAGITIDDKSLRERFEISQLTYMIDHNIVSHENLVKYLQGGSRSYEALEGLETKFGGSIDELLQNPEVAEKMAQQIEGRVKIQSPEELAKTIDESEIETLDEVLWIQTVEYGAFDKEKLPVLNGPISRREILLSKLTGKPYRKEVFTGVIDYRHEKYENVVRDPRDSEWYAADAYERRIKEERQARITSKDIAEADKENALTKTEVGGIRKLINKIKEFFKGKGEK